MMEQANNSPNTELAFFCVAEGDARLNPMHISLYFVFFQLWLKNNSQNPISITRKTVMKSSKIKSFATYHKCILELHNYGYLAYLPSYHPAIGSTIYLLRNKEQER